MGLFTVVLLNFIRSMTGIEDWALLAEKIEIYIGTQWHVMAASCFCFKSGKLDTPENISKKYF